MKKIVKEWLPTMIIIACIVCIKIFAIDTVEVSGISMYPTLKDKDNLLIEKISNFNHEYKRGDIVILHPFQNSKTFYVKRIIALQNETVECVNGKIYIDGNELKEAYLPKDLKTSTFTKIKVPSGEIFVLGDNREHSKDSREIGTVPVEQVRGSMVYRYHLFYK